MPSGRLTSGRWRLLSPATPSSDRLGAPVSGSFFTKPSTHAPTNSRAARPRSSRMLVRQPLMQPRRRFLTCDFASRAMLTAPP